jgi:pyruvyl transferase EpsO
MKLPARVDSSTTFSEGVDRRTREAAQARLQGLYLTGLDDALDNASDVVLLDWPAYSNVGDGLILLGQLEALRQLGRPIRAASSLNLGDFQRIRQCLGPSTAILLQGGGNLGTLWPAHQHYREAVLEAFADRAVVQLPQSICFDGERATEVFARAIRRHGRFTLMVRDQGSEAFARGWFDCPVRRLPDAALMLAPARPAKARLDVLALLRTDKEAGADAFRLRAVLDASGNAMSIRQADWLDDGVPERLLLLALEVLQRYPHRLDTDGSDRGRMIWTQLAALRLQRGAALLAEGRVLLTDRLHAALLGCLLGMPVVALDNCYGKLSAVLGDWMAGWPGLFLETDPDAAVARVRSLLGSTALTPMR